MKLGYRYGRIAILVLLAILIEGISGGINGFSIYFGAGMLVSAFLTMIYVFINFDETLDEKLLMEMIIDGFSGLIIFTYPYSDNRFFIIVFSFWIVFMGILLLTAGNFNKKDNDFLWFNILSGIVFIVFGFSIMHVSKDNQGILNYLISFVLFIYAASHCRNICKRKQDVY